MSVLIGIYIIGFIVILGVTIWLAIHSPEVNIYQRIAMTTVIAIFWPIVIPAGLIEDGLKNIARSKQ